MTLSESAVARFWSYVSKSLNPNDCWLWLGSKTGRKNYKYGSMMINYRNYQAHIISYIIHNNIDTNGFHVHHKCRNRLCVNPKHLSLEDPSTHARFHASTREPKPKRMLCLRGHDISTDDKVYIISGRRFCKICKRVTNSFYKEMKRAIN